MLARLETPLGWLLHAAATGTLEQVEDLRWSDDCAVTVVVAAEGYPAAPVTGDPIEGCRGRRRAARRHRAGRRRVDRVGRRPGARRWSGWARPSRTRAPTRTRGWPRSGCAAPTTAPTSRWPPPAARSACPGRDRGPPRAETIAPVSKPAIPNVLATRYASAPMALLWSPEHKVVLERRLWLAVLEAQRDLGVAVPDGAVEAYARGGRPGRPGLDRRPRAGHPARREGADRGVLRARRPRAHPQGHDLAATSPRTSSSCRCAASLEIVRDKVVAVLARLARLAAEHDDLVMAGRSHNVAGPGHHARQALRDRPPTSCWSRTRGSRTCSRATRCAGSRARSAPPRTCSTCSTATPTSWPTSSSGSPGTSASSRCSTRVGQVYPRSLDFDVVSALVQIAAGAVQPGHHDPADGRAGAGHRGLPGRARSAPARCRTR